MLQVEVVYARADAQEVVALAVATGATARDAVDASGLRRHAEIGSGALALAIFGTRIEGETVLRDGDRVEILRPLACDPGEVRKQRAAAQRARR